MMIVTARTPEGFVIRLIGPSGERAYRKNAGGGYSLCLDHKGPWVNCERCEMPPAVQDKFSAHTEGVSE